MEARIADLERRTSENDEQSLAWHYKMIAAIVGWRDSLSDEKPQEGAPSVSPPQY
jgi:hypothetical protein